MKKMSTIACMTVAGMLGLGTYILVNKNTKTKADRLINKVLDKANMMTQDIMD